MSPLKLALLLRAHSQPRPNRDLPPQQAFAPAMLDAVAEFNARGLVHPFVDADTMRHGCIGHGGGYGLLLTPKGEALAQRILLASADFYEGAAARHQVAVDGRGA